MISPSSDRLLLIDIGNTNLKWAWYKGGRISSIQSAPHRGAKITDLADAFWGLEPAPAGIAIANVAGDEIEHDLGRWMQLRWRVEPDIIRTEASALGVINAYKNPDQLGVDRWLTLIAVHVKWKEAFCIVDCGSAITIDLIDAKGEHQGGLILPGFNMMKEALLEKTRIPRIGEVETPELLARDTATAVSSAGLHAAAALVERVLLHAVGLFDETPRLVITGNDAVKLLKVLDKPAEIEQDLVMMGLGYLATAEMNCI